MVTGAAEGGGPGLGVRRLRDDLARLGVRAGAVVLVQASMKEIGWIDGGAATLLRALRDCVGPAGTLVAPTQTANNSTTTREFLARAAGTDAAGRQRLEDAIAGFAWPDTPSYRMGRLAEALRTTPGAARSRHPQTSFAALGPAAERLTAVHDLSDHLGERSPLARLHADDALLVLVGVSFSNGVALHLAEHRLPWKLPVRPYHCYVVDGDKRERVDFVAPDLDDGDFGTLGAALERTSDVAMGRVGNALSRVVPMRKAVSFAVDWMIRHRGPGLSGRAGRRGR